jgi:hypothetical protein
MDGPSVPSCGPVCQAFSPNTAGVASTNTAKPAIIRFFSHQLDLLLYGYYLSMLPQGLFYRPPPGSLIRHQTSDGKQWSERQHHGTLCWDSDGQSIASESYALRVFACGLSTFVPGKRSIFWSGTLPTTFSGWLLHRQFRRNRAHGSAAATRDRTPSLAPYLLRDRKAPAW